MASVKALLARKELIKTWSCIFSFRFFAECAAWVVRARSFAADHTGRLNDHRDLTETSSMAR
ncbi:hypothetical protein EDWATA_01049 [Edwardsiella tarda ATCC 23685]|uniref:Uncharacterized protein n=1 Tax=Edwardsiella tarda ATCC 23685 TaxID=500638 RepID=D4F2U8_EDWTA|nr:hypothetical protein EDWATA_01049 [Edwardsiella tarda ATCC 23685]